MPNPAPPGSGSRAAPTELRDARFRSIPTFRTLDAILDDNAARFGVYDALVFDGRTYTNRELADQSTRLAGAFDALGIGPGDRVAVHLANSPEVWIAYLACARLGAAVVPTPPSLTARELAFILEDCAARVLLTDGATGAALEPSRARLAGLERVIGADRAPPGGQRLADLMRNARGAAPVRAADALDLAAIIYTSGTTGQPKGVMLGHGQLAAAACLNYGFYVGPDEDPRAAPLLMPLPLCHIYGLTVALTTLMMGNLMVLMRRFEVAAALELVQAHRIGIFPAVPTMLMRLLAEPAAPAALRSIVQWDCGGSPLPAEVLDQVERQLGGLVTEGWGLSEAGGAVAQNTPQVPRKRGSAGLPLPGFEVEARDERGAALTPGGVGELVVRGPSVMPGYWNRPAETAAALDRDGWLHTGDVGHLDADGYCFLLGRKDDLIIRGGENISPREIEELLQTHPGVEEAAVIGLPDPVLGQRVGAFVVAAAGAELPAGALRDFCAGRLARFKVPDHIEIVAELPHNATGKVLKRDLRRRAGAD